MIRQWLMSFSLCTQSSLAAAVSQPTCLSSSTGLAHLKFGLFCYKIVDCPTSSRVLHD